MVEQLRIGRKKYTLTKSGEGSFTSIYFARALKNDQIEYVVKLVRPELPNAKLTHARLAEEKHILNSLAGFSNHFPGQIISGHIDRQPYIGYRYLPGKSLSQLLKHWSPEIFTVHYCCLLIDKLFSAIRELHKKHPAIVHSDLSPENIIVNQDKLYLIDFGCAQQLAKPDSATRWIGKASYLSPEQARAENWGQKSDIYQAGIIFYECLTGQKWNKGNSRGQKTAFASNPPQNTYSNIPLRLRPLIRSMLQPQKEKRIDSIELCQKRLSFALTSMDLSRLSGTDLKNKRTP